MDCDQEWLFRSCETGSHKLVKSCKDGDVVVVKNSVIFMAKLFGITFEEFCESDFLILDSIVVDQLKTALSKLFISNVETVEDLFNAVETQKADTQKVQTHKVDNQKIQTRKVYPPEADTLKVKTNNDIKNNKNSEIELIETDNDSELETTIKEEKYDFLTILLNALFVRRLSNSLWLKEDFRSKCEYLKPSHLLIEGCTLEIGLGKTKYSLNVYLTTHWSVHVRARAKNVRARLIPHS